MLLAAFIAVMAFAQKANSGVHAVLPYAKAVTQQTPQNVGSLASYAMEMPATALKTRTPRKVAGELVTPPEGEVVYYKLSGTIYASQTTSSIERVVTAIFDGNDFYVTGLSIYCEDAWVKGTISDNIATFPMGQYVGNPGVDLYFTGMDDSDELCDVTADYDAETGNFTFTNYILDNQEISEGLGYYAAWFKGTTLTKIEGDVDLPVEAPEDLNTEEYTVKGLSWSIDDNDNLVSTETAFNVQVGYVSTSATSIDIYVKGLCSYLPDAWVKGTGAIASTGLQVKFPAGQLFGTFANKYEMWFAGLSDLNEEAVVQDVVFNVDMSSMTLTLAGGYVAINGKKDAIYWYNAWSELVISKVQDKAAMPANPTITELENSAYGYIVGFDIPTVDTEGNGLLSDKLAYMIYTDIEGEIAPLTFTPATHTRLTEDMTEIPYGFTEAYDFYPTYIYLNELYSADWNNIGIQSIYYGGDETNATEIQWFHIKDYTPSGPGEYTFNFNEMDVPVSSNVGTDGDITEDKTLTSGAVALTISPKEESVTSQNRFWSTAAGPQLRVYSGTLTFKVPEGMNITSIVFNHNGKWGANTVGEIEIPNDADAKVATWTPAEGEDATSQVVVNIAANSQINSIVVTIAAGGDEPIEPEEGVFTFDDSTMEGWTTIDADGDGYCWTIASTILGKGYGHKGSTDCVVSQSYINSVGALTPDNYLVSPKMELGGMISFYACGQDASWPAEHFAVAVSTAGNTDAADFTNVQEWTMTAARDGYQPTNARSGAFRGPKKAQGSWYLYTVDLSAYEGQEGYVAIRHFNCTDNYMLDIDDISFVTPDYMIEPEEGVVESLSDFTLKFNNYDVAIVEGEIAQAELYKDENFDEPVATAALSLNENVLSFSFDDITEAGAYTLLIPEGTLQNVTEEKILGDLEFFYTIEAAPEVPELVELPEGVEPIEYTLTASGAVSSYYGWSDQSVEETRLVAFDGTDVYVQGLAAAYFPEGYVKGTLTADGQVVFKSGQLIGEDEYGPEYLIGLNANMEVADYVFDFDAESRTLTLADGYYVYEAGTTDGESLYAYLESAVYTEGALVLPFVELPEGVEPEEWTLEGFYSDGQVGNDTQYAVGVAFDGTDVYVQGLAYWFDESWLKGTLDEETGIVTFPLGQFVGKDEYGREYMVGFDGDFCDIQYVYDAEAKTLTQVTPYVMESQTETGLDDEGEFAFWGFWEASYFYAGEPIAVEPVEVPEGLQTETYLFAANELVEEEPDRARVLKAEGDETTATFDFNKLGTEEEPWPVSSGTGDNYDPAGEITEPLVLTEDNVTLTIYPAEEDATPTRFWKTNNGPQLRVYNGTLTFMASDDMNITSVVFNYNGKYWGGNNNAGNVEADSGVITDDADSKAATWTGEAQSVMFTFGGNTQINSINVTVAETGEEPTPIDPVEPTLEPYTSQIQVGFDGNDVYFSGISDNTADMWMKGTLSEDGTTVTIPANQYMGTIAGWYVFDYYMTAVDEEGEFTDLVLNYDAENNKFTTDQTVMLNGSRFVYYPYQEFTDVEITKMPEFAATPADPVLEDFILSEATGYSKIYASIPTTDVDGNDLLTSKLFYTLWYEKDGVEQPYTFTADLYYNDFEEDVTEVPYSHDGYDIYKGGEIIYLEETKDELITWSKVGIQSIYWGAGERNVSNIVWMENAEYSPTTGITTVKADDMRNAAIYNLAGQRLQTVQKGLNIINGRKVMVK